MTAVDRGNGEMAEGKLPSLGLCVRLLVLMGAVVVVYRPGLAYTYSGVFESFDPSGPLLFVPFVPLAALAVAATRWRGVADEPESVPQRAADIAVALLLFALAFVTAAVSPDVFGNETLTWRGDLISLTPFVAGLVTLLFGARMLYRLRPALLLLTTMAPALYRPVLAAMGSVVDTGTTAGVRALDLVLPSLATTRSPEGLYGQIDGPDGAFTVAVTQACAGSGAVLGGLLLTGVVLLTSTGSLRARISWGVSTVALCWLGNLLRLAILFVVGAESGAPTMLGELHVWLGATMLMLVSSCALLLTRPFGLSFRTVPGQEHPLRCLPQLNVATVSLAALAALVVVTPAVAATTQFDFLSGDSSASRPSASAAVPSVAGVVALQPISWAPTYFGTGASWDRWLVFDPDDPGARSSPIAVDVIGTRDGARFDQYGLVACYGYHGYDIEAQGTVDLPGGRTGESITYVVPDAEARVYVLSWRQRTDDGRLERVVVQRRLSSARAAGTGGQLLALAGELIRSGSPEVPDASLV